MKLTAKILMVFAILLMPCALILTGCGKDKHYITLNITNNLEEALLGCEVKSANREVDSSGNHRDYVYDNEDVIIQAFVAKGYNIIDLYVDVNSDPIEFVISDENYEYNSQESLLYTCNLGKTDKDLTVNVTAEFVKTAHYTRSYWESTVDNQVDLNDVTIQLDNPELWGLNEKELTLSALKTFVGTGGLLMTSLEYGSTLNFKVSPSNVGTVRITEEFITPGDNIQMTVKTDENYGYNFSLKVTGNGSFKFNESGLSTNINLSYRLNNYKTSDGDISDLNSPLYSFTTNNHDNTIKIKDIIDGTAQIKIELKEYDAFVDYYNLMKIFINDVQVPVSVTNSITIDLNKSYTIFDYTTYYNYYLEIKIDDVEEAMLINQILTSINTNAYTQNFETDNMIQSVFYEFRNKNGEATDVGSYFDTESNQEQFITYLTGRPLVMKANIYFNNEKTYECDLKNLEITLSVYINGQQEKDTIKIGGTNPVNDYISVEQEELSQTFYITFNADVLNISSITWNYIGTVA